MNSSNSSNNGGIYCIELKVNYADKIEVYLFSYLVPVLCLIGAVTNSINFVVLRDKSLKTPTYTYLAALAGTQVVALLSQAFYMASLLHFNRNPTATALNAYFLWPIYNGATTLTLVLTVTYTIDRYFFVRKFNSSSKSISLRKRARKISLLVCIVATLLNIPRMAVMKQRSDIPSCQAYRYSIKTDLWFGIYSTLRFIFFNLGSLFLMAIFNTLLLTLVWRANSATVGEQQDTTAMAYNNNNGKSTKISKHHAQQRSLTTTLIVATLVTMLAETYATLFNPITEILLWNRFKLISAATMRNMRMLTFPVLFIEYSAGFAIYFLMNINFQKYEKSY